MDRNELSTILPHREPMLLVDSSEEVGEEALSTYLVRGNEFFLQGHFPGNPIVPGAILCEIMAQSSVLLMKDEMTGRLALYAGMDKVRFRRQVRPGDLISVKSRMQQHRGRYFIVHSEAFVDGTLCCSGDLSFTLIDKDV